MSIKHPHSRLGLEGNPGRHEPSTQSKRKQNKGHPSYLEVPENELLVPRPRDDVILSPESQAGHWAFVPSERLNNTPSLKKERKETDEDRGES